MAVKYTIATGSYVRKYDGFTETLLDDFPLSDIPEAGGYSRGALDLDENLLIHADTSSGVKVYKLDGFSSTVLDSFYATFFGAGAYYSGMTWDAFDLILGCKDESGIYRVWKLSGFSATIVDSFDSPAAYLTGLSWRGDGNLVVLTKNDFYLMDGFSASILDSTANFSSNLHFGLSSDKELYLYLIDHDAGTSKQMSFDGTVITSLGWGGTGIEVEPRLPSAWIYSYHGSTPTGVRVNKVRFKAADDDNPDMAYPIKIPSSGSHYSFWKHIALVAIKAPDNFINNVKFYVESPIDWPGCVLRCGLVDNYAQATGVQGVTGDEASTYHPDHPTMDDVNNYTSSNPLSIPGSIGNTTGKVTDGYLLLQLEVTPSAQPGITPEGNLIIEYDEA